MYKLLNAGFYRLIKNKIFLGVIVITLCMAVFFLMNLNNVGNSIELLIMNHFGTIGFFISIFTTLFVGLEYANGTIRNKIVAGHSRIKIYLSNLIISITVGIIIELVYIIFISIVGDFILDKLQVIFSVSQFIKMLLQMTIIIVMYSTIFNCITLLYNDITVSTVICIIFIFIMFLVDGTLAMIANSEKYSYYTRYDENGEVFREINGLNPNYPGETKKQIAKMLRNFIPIGQSNQISEAVSEQINQSVMNYKGEIPNTTNLLWYSLGTIILINTMGIYLFDKKELK